MQSLPLRGLVWRERNMFIRGGRSRLNCPSPPLIVLYRQRDEACPFVGISPLDNAKLLWDLELAKQPISVQIAHPLSEMPETRNGSDLGFFF